MFFFRRLPTAAVEKDLIQNFGCNGFPVKVVVVAQTLEVRPKEEEESSSTLTAFERATSGFGWAVSQG